MAVYKTRISSYGFDGMLSFLFCLFVLLGQSGMCLAFYILMSSVSECLSRILRDVTGRKLKYPILYILKSY